MRLNSDYEGAFLYTFAKNSNTATYPVFTVIVINKNVKRAFFMIQG